MPNEDAWGFAQFGQTSALWLIDGCTDLDRERSKERYPGSVSSAHWHKEALSRALSGHPCTSLTQDPREYLMRVVEQVRHGYDSLGLEEVEDWAYPSSTFVWAALFPKEDILRVVWTGDSVCVVRSARQGISVFPHWAPGAGAATQDRGCVKDLQWHRRRRSEHIRSGDTGISIFPDRLVGVEVADLEISAGAEVLLASDGFYRIVNVLRDVEPDNLFERINENGLHAVGNRLRNLEDQARASLQSSQPKVHDDATVVLAAVC